jgi:hypothetical protein
VGDGLDRVARRGDLYGPRHECERSRVFYDNGDTLPTGLAKNTTYYVKTVVDANSFTLSTTAGGAVINTSGSRSGTHKLGAVGLRYYADTAGGANTEGSGTSYLPGNAAGTATSPGWFN